MKMRWVLGATAVLQCTDLLQIAICEIPMTGLKREREREKKNLGIQKKAKWGQLVLKHARPTIRAQARNAESGFACRTQKLKHVHAGGFDETRGKLTRHFVLCDARTGQRLGV